MSTKHIFRAAALVALVAVIAAGAQLLQKPPAHSASGAVATERGTSLGFR